MASARDDKIGLPSPESQGYYFSVALLMKASFVLLGLAILACAGCTIPRTFFATADCDYKRVRLRHWAENSASESATIRVLLVHGMNNHPFGFKGGKPELYGCATYTDLQTKLSGPLNWQQLEELRNLA